MDTIIVIALSVVIVLLISVLVVLASLGKQETQIVYKTPHGYWIVNGDLLCCSKCGRESAEASHFCSHCGSFNRRMR